MSSNQGLRLEIVVLDDEPLVLAGVSMLLESLGHTVFQAVNGEQVLTTINEGRRFDLGIFDLSIRNGQGGQEIVSQVAAIDASMKLVVTSGFQADDILMNCSDYGFHDALPKPFSRNQLSALVDRLFG